MSQPGVPPTRMLPGVRALTAILAVGAILLGVMALHLAGGGHGAADAADHSHGATTLIDHSHDGSAVDAVGLAPSSLADAAPRVHAGNAQSLSAVLACGPECMMTCALMAIACVLFVVLVSLVMVANGPDRRPMRRLARDASIFREIRQHISAPSLSALSISRT